MASLNSRWSNVRKRVMIWLDIVELEGKSPGDISSDWFSRSGSVVCGRAAIFPEWWRRYAFLVPSPFEVQKIKLNLFVVLLFLCWLVCVWGCVCLCGGRRYATGYSGGGGSFCWNMLFPSFNILHRLNCKHDLALNLNDRCSPCQLQRHKQLRALIADTKFQSIYAQLTNNLYTNVIIIHVRRRLVGESQSFDPYKCNSDGLMLFPLTKNCQQFLTLRSHPLLTSWLHLLWFLICGGVRSSARQSGSSVSECSTHLLASVFYK